MKGKDEIQNLFSDKLGGYEAKVNPDLWGKVASKISAGTAATATGMALTTKFIIGLGAASIIAVTAFVVLDTEEAPAKEVAVVEQPIEKPTKEVITKEIPVVTLELPDLTNVDPSTEPVVLVAAVNPTPTPFTEIAGPVVITPAERIRMEDNPLDNVFKEDDQLNVSEDTTTVVPLTVDPVAAVAEDIITDESTEIKIVFPNVFTPNNDNINDHLFISNTEDLDKESFLISIVDESFKEVYSSEDPNFIWDGTDKGGNPLKAGYYIALITCKDLGGKEAKPVMYQFEIKK